MSGKLTAAILENGNKISFHTPSHAGVLPDDITKTDVTELPYTDNLLSSVSYIAELERKTASVYKAEACFISTQGATHNIFQAVYSVSKLGAFLIVGNAHVSVYNALSVCRAKAYHADAFCDSSEIPSDVKTVIFTSPDYFGNVLPVKEYCDLLRKNGYVSIMDSAHGSHFEFSSKLPESASEYADLAILSLHKTLPVLTGGSVLCCKNEYAEKALLARKIFHTTSPSFMTMCSIERAIDLFEKDGERLYDEVLEEVGKFVSAVKSPFSVKKTQDPTRVVLTSPFDGGAVEEALRNEGFVAETTFGRDVVFIVNPYNYRHLAALGDAVNGIGRLPLYAECDLPYKPHPKPAPIEFGCDAERILLTEAKGRKAFVCAGLYPPGTPLIYPGDEITERDIAFLAKAEREKRVFGVENGLIYVIK